MSAPQFIHLHAHSAYSLLEGALPVAELIKRAKADNQPALGIADSSNLFGALEFSEKAASAGLQPLIGCQVNIQFEIVESAGPKRKEEGVGKIVLYAMNDEGFTVLSELISRAYLKSENGLPVLDPTWLDDLNLSDLICLSGGPEGAIDRAIADDLIPLAHERLDKLRDWFGDRCYIELQRHGLAHEQKCEPRLIEYAYAHNVPLVATNEPFFGQPDQFESHDALLAIASGSVIAQTARRKLSDQHYFKSQKDMAALFADLPEALQNTLEIAKRIHFRPKTRGPILPSFSAEAAKTPEQAVELEAQELARQAREGLTKRIAEHGIADGSDEQTYRDRLELELEIIQNMKYPGYFLIVADFIKWAKEQDIPVGPGRGSGAGSLVAFALTITNIDPLRYNLLFERFLNPERVSMPDFDIDFCQDGREHVIQYVQDKYGSEQVAQIITFGSLQARAALRDVGRVLQMPYGQVDRICKLVPSNPANPVSIDQAVKDEPQLQVMRDEDETVAQLLQIGSALEGLYRHASTHAAGIVIGDRPLQNLVPLYRDPRSEMQVTQYSLKWVEPAGLVKFDFLGLKTLTVIKHAIALANRKGADLEADRIPIDDPETYALLQRAETLGVFQFESAGMRRALIDMQPDRFEDTIALGALFRPGPMDNIPAFCARKHGREKYQNLHPLMEPILSETYGIIVYQEQVMQIARSLGGYSLGQADMLRRAMGKKDRAVMNAQKSDFIEGCAANDIDKKLATQVFDLLAKFADYGFNKSHAAAYALVSVQTAYLKAHHPAEFIAASMTLDMANTDKLAEFKREADRLKIPVHAPDINNSQVAFDVQDNAIVYSLCAVKGVGRQVAEHIVQVREGGAYASLSDFAARIDPKIISRRTLESLINAGAFDSLVEAREQAFEVIDAIVGTAQRINKDRDTGISDMFASNVASDIPLNANYTPWRSMEKLDREFAAIGFHLSGHPLDQYRTMLEEKNIQPWSQFEQSVKQGASAGRIAGLLVSRNDRRTRKGAPMSILTLSDPTGSFECLVFSEQLSQNSETLTVGNALILDVGAENQPDGVRLRLLRANTLQAMSMAQEKSLTIHAMNKECLNQINTLLDRGGNGTIAIRVQNEMADKEYELELEGKFQVSPELASGIKSIPGVSAVRLS